MLIVLQLIILLFLLGMIALWATYGFFSAFIQLIVIIAAGVFALAVWEPLTHVLLGRMPAYAHGVGLLAPFALAIIILRVGFDYFCRMNLSLPHLADQIGGGLCGLLAGILAFGMFINGANYLPIDRSAMGYEPFTIQGNDVETNPKGQFFTFLRVNEWSASFYTFLSGGAMSPIGGPSIDEVRPNYARSAEISRVGPVDTNQMRSAHPESVQVTGVYAIPATDAAIKGMVERATLVFFLAEAYKTPTDITFGEDGMGQVKAIRRDLRNRFDDPDEHGKPEGLINFPLIKEIATKTLEASQASQKVLLEEIKAANEAGEDKKLDELEKDLAKHEDLIALFEPIAEQPQSQASFDAMVQFTTAELTRKLLKNDGGEPNSFAQALSPDKTLWIVDTKWNNERPGTYNPDDSKLRVAIPQIRLQVKAGNDLELVPPIGYSIEYSPNTKGRTFTELLTNQRYTAFSQYSDFHLGWAFLLPNGQEPVRFFARELRFDLTKLPNAKGEESSVVQNIGAVAQVFGAPGLPSPEAKEGDGTSYTPSGVKVGSTGAYAEVSEALPRSFGGASSTSIKADKTTEPWTLQSGQDDSITPGRSGGKRSTIRNIYVADDSRLIRIKMDSSQYQSLLGKARGAAENLSELRVSATDGNTYAGIGFVKVRSDGVMQLDIRGDGVAQRGLHPSELPTVGKDESLYVYFQVPVGSTIDALLRGGDTETFAEPLTVEANDKR